MADAAVRRNVTTARVVAVRDGRAIERTDRLAAEEPMEIRARGPGQGPISVAVTMRTPGGDFELACGFLYTEGLIGGREDVVRVSYCEDPGPEEQRFNVVTVELARPLDPASLRRNFYATSSCGVCGKAALEDVEIRCAPLPPGFAVRAEVLARLPDELRRAQRVFELTGGLHAAGLFDGEGNLLAVREDVGRHNAVDKLVGEAVLRGELPLSERILQVSGRVSFEIVQKAAVAGIPVVAAVSAPSSLAVQAADRLGIAVAGFVRGGRFNVYAHPERVAR
ncbi:MAG TPA: formate dehydrogenase accessory sulfurtransferase FdhD [Actinomycetota bacterium]|nr:formate dehydrogenase accessory sulfurtransferase FdhD [Actinomycetota bacterium]